MAKSRLIGDYPVIGIRPTIDGRQCTRFVRGADHGHGSGRQEVV